MALGLTLIWGSSRMLNLDHCSLYLVGGYLAWTIIDQLHLPLALAFLLAVASAALVGLILQVALINPLLGKEGWDSASLIATLGASIVLESAALLIYGPQVKQMPTVVEGQFKIGTVLISNQALIVIATAVLFLVLMSVFLRASRHGLAIRAISQNMDAARLAGVPARTAFLIVMRVVRPNGLFGLGEVRRL